MTVAKPRLLDTAEEQQSYLWQGRNGAYAKLSASAYHLLELHAAGKSFDDIAAMMRQQGQQASAAELAAAHAKIQAKLDALEAQPPRKPWGFWFRLPLIPADTVAALSARLAALFKPWIGGPIALLALLAIALFFAQEPLWFDMSVGAVAQVYGLFLLSFLVHEFGHTSACMRFGVRPSHIGLTVYLIYPALYSDVTAVWSLPRWQRVIVDLSGIAFQLAFGALYAAGYLLWGWEPLKLTFWLIVYNSVFALNPIFKFDGYWVLADGLGVPNLGQQVPRIARYMWNTLRGRPAEALPWSDRTLSILTAYAVIAVAVWAFFIGRLVPKAWAILLAYPATLRALYDQATSAAATLTLQHFGPALMGTFTLLVTGLLLYRLATAMLRFGRA